MKNIYTVVLFIAVIVFPASAQVSLNPILGEQPEFAVNKNENSDKYWIYFDNKIDIEFLKQNPNLYLSQRAIQRRTNFNIPISYSDVPVSNKNIAALESAGIQVIVISKWLNAVSAYLSPQQRKQIELMDGIAAIHKVKKLRSIDESTLPYNNNVFYKTSSPTDITGVYGSATNQIEQINLDTILDLGYTGTDMVIAVLDAGFFGADTATLFQSFWAKDQILGVRNFPDHNNQVFNIASGYHGSWVMSVIGGDITDTYSGSAPDADFYLYRTEVADSEYVVEEDYWVVAAEKADSVGADLINSSLGYTTFDDPLENHTYEDLDGNTSVISIGADMAAEKGILVCNSAGNEGANTWHYVSMPSDGDSVFSIGGVDTNGIHVAFSGYGPTFDGRLKPNVVALASGSSVLDPGGAIINLSGTSFSSPLIAGACASLWQAFPSKNNMEIIDAVQRSAHLYLTPNDSMGYGIPNFGLAYEILLSELDTVVIDTTIEDTVVIDTTIEDTTLVSILDILPNPATDFFEVMLQLNENGPATLQFHNLAGALVYEEKIYLTKDVPVSVTVNLQNRFTPGIYLFSVTAGRFKQSNIVFVE